MTYYLSHAARKAFRQPALASLIGLLISSSLLNGQGNFTSLFNGKDLTDWEGQSELWKVENGEIVGTTEGNPLENNTFLIYKGSNVSNFHLKVKLKMLGESNSGIMYRAQPIEGIDYALSGPQMDIHPKLEYQGMYYSEKTGRGIVAQRGQKVTVPADLNAKGKTTPKVTGTFPLEPSFKLDEWNEYEIIAVNKRQIHRINGVVTIDLIDRDPSAPTTGAIGFQLHRGPDMTIYVKDVELRNLRGGEAREAIQYALSAPGTKKKEGPREGLAINENRATPVDRIKVPQGFKVELLYSVPGDTQGSWVNLGLDGKNRIIASDQFGSLYRFKPPAAGKALDPADIEKVPVNIRAVNGMLWAFDSLYVGVNDYEDSTKSGLYRITDTNGDDQLDHVELLRQIPSRGDHGVHAVKLSPDGKSIFLICGNNAEPTPVDASRVLENWGEDHLLPRMPDGRGHNRDRLAPAGTIYKVSPDGQHWERYSMGYRNIFDADFNADGELFTYDADMEYDFNTSWYRPTRVNHVVSGSDYGWRNGTGKWAEWYVDSVPAAVNIGAGSPTGVTFGYGAKFPAKYQKALFIMDWSWGKLYSVNLRPEGSSYTGEKEDFVSGVPLPLTDMVIHPDDGAMYFTIGGRKVQSGLYRVSYVGDEDTSPIDAKSPGQDARDVRIVLEQFHGKQDDRAVQLAWYHLDHDDPFIRNAARRALESQPANGWGRRAFREQDPGKKIPALLALTRVRGIDPFHRKDSDPPINQAQGTRILNALADLDYGSLSERHRQALVRTYHVALNRFRGTGAEVVNKIIAQLDPHFPAKTLESNRLLCETLGFLQAPNTARKGIALLKSATTQEEQLEYARSLRLLTNGWTNALRTEYFEWFLRATNYRGGASFVKFVENIRLDVEASLTEQEKIDLAEILARKPVIKSPLEEAMSSLAGRSTFTNWKLDDLADAGNNMTGRDFKRGRTMFAATACYSCHRFKNQGGATGPDLTSAGGRYSPRDSLDQIINPSKEINEQFVPVQVSMLDGTSVHGIIVNLKGDVVVVNTDLTDPFQRTDVDRKLVKSIDPSPVSPMPPALLGLLEKEEIYDLVAYVLSGGNPEDERFQ
ncbi:MAG: DUF1080 domain-containing protein [Verrucomicrobia bacterium]|nr:DUF1080 domain-containing protein [Verrucomicrobiota bacterium]